MKSLKKKQQFGKHLIKLVSAQLVRQVKKEAIFNRFFLTALRCRFFNQWQHQMESGNSFFETFKSVAAAESYRIKGNEFYKQRNFREALVEYNKSICCAPAESKELGLAYANRSSIYFELRMYRTCVENIKLARKSHYPDEKMKVLNDREEKCHKLIKSGALDIDFDVWDFFKLSYKPNKKVPFIIEGLELAESEKYGRMIVTTRDLKAGNIIAIEKPCFTELEVYAKDHCNYCLKNNHFSLMPCEKCPKGLEITAAS